MDLLTGIKVVVSPALPIRPSFSEDIHRRVRHGLADALACIGEEPGPEPGAATHAISVHRDGMMFVSQQVYDQFMQIKEDLDASQAVA